MADKELYLNKPEPTKKKVGFWKGLGKDYKYPDPVPQDKPGLMAKNDIRNLKKIQTWARSTSYKGTSACRLCGCDNGSKEYECGDFVWPEGYLHYLEVHNVEIDQPFAMFLAQQDSNVGRFKKGR